MLRPQGYGIITDPDARGGVAIEFDTFTCKHCQRVTIVRPGESATNCGGWCGSCAAPICGVCADLGVCTPWEKQMEKMEARDRLLRSVGL